MAAHSYCYHHRRSPDLGKLAEILDDVSVEMIPLCYCWGCRTFQTASHIYVIHIRCLNTLNSCGWASMAAHSHCYHHRGFPRFWRAGWNPRRCMWEWSQYAIVEAVEPFHTYIRCLNTLNSCGWAYGSTFILLPSQTFPRFGRAGWNHRWCQCGNDPTMLSLRL